MKNGILIGLGISVAVLILLFWKGCGDNKSAVARALAAEASAIKWKAHGDSADRHADSTIKKAHADSIFYAHRDDSLLKRFAKADTSVNHAKATIGALVAIGDAAAERKDTATQLSSCKELRDSLKIANGAVSDLQTSAETLNSAFGNEVQQLHGTINSLAGDIIQLRTAKDSLAAIAIKVAKENAKLAKPKRFVVGIGGTTTIVGGQVKEVFGIQATYSIIRF